MGDNETIRFAQRSIGSVADEFPRAVEVFENAGIDYSCKGKQSLADAAIAAGYRAEELIALIHDTPRPAGAIQWSQRPTDELVRFLTKDHGDTAARAMPAIRESLEALAAQHPHLTNIRRIAALFATFLEMMTAHTTREERDLFSSLAVNNRGSAGPPSARLSQRVLRELVEHGMFREQLRTMRELCLLTRDDCADEIFVRLTEFSRAVHYHMHLENNVLYPRAIDFENQLLRAS